MKKQKNIPVNQYAFFKQHLWHELNRYDKNGKHIQSVTCTEENIDNLYNSQFEDKTAYGEVFFI